MVAASAATLVSEDFVLNECPTSGDAARSTPFAGPTWTLKPRTAHISCPWASRHPLAKGCRRMVLPLQAFLQAPCSRCSRRCAHQLPGCRYHTTRGAEFGSPFQVRSGWSYIARSVQFSRKTQLAGVEFGTVIRTRPRGKHFCPHCISRSSDHYVCAF